MSLVNQTKPQGNLGSIIVPSNAVFAVVAYDEGDHVHAKTVWNSNYDHLCRDDRERLFIAVQDATNEAMFKHISRAKPRASDKRVQTKPQGSKRLKRFEHKLAAERCPDCAEPLIEHVPVLSKLDKPYFVCPICDRVFEASDLDKRA